eukprot:TRINITY_DN15702_c0_g1_i1.p1 TRINITY_DN15702_c0_g1~~TRINITY_DN15702_c0_g1_i1.p1  ORF type:complete len:521 (+),score=122.41 TRINITY_DN15702_c0_g1_i1:103-1665(+)
MSRLLAHILSKKAADTVRQQLPEPADFDIEVKNTFIHFGGEKEEALPFDLLKMPLLVRGSTAPAAWRSEVSSDLPDEETDSFSGGSSFGETEEVGSQGDDDATDVPEEQPAYSEINWEIGSRKFDSRDTGATKTVTLVLGNTTYEFVLTIKPRQIGNGRGEANFRASEGCGSIQVKCNETVHAPCKMRLDVGGEITGCTIEHDFAEAATVTFPMEWNFRESLAGVERGSVVCVRFGAGLLPLAKAPKMLPLQRIPMPPVDMCDMVDGPDGMGPDDTGACSGDGFTTPSTLTPEATPRWTAADGQQSPVSQAAQLFEAQSPAQESYAGAIDWVPYWQDFYFDFCLRKADGGSLGLGVNGDDGVQLVVNDVAEDGAVAAWNRQCKDKDSAKVVLPGDRIICVNGKHDAAGMKHECKEALLLKITVARWVCTMYPAYVPTVWVPVPVPFPIMAPADEQCTSDIPQAGSQYDVAETSAGDMPTNAYDEAFPPLPSNEGLPASVEDASLAGEYPGPSGSSLTVWQ